MSLTTLKKVVEEFIRVTYRLSEPDLEINWVWETYDVEGLRYAFFRTYEELCQLSVTLATERASHQITTTTAQRILAQYHTAYRDLQAVLLNVDNEADYSPSKSVWPLREVMAHIIFAEYQSFTAIWRALVPPAKDVSLQPELPLKIGPLIDYSLGSDLDDSKPPDFFLIYGQSAGILAYYDQLHTLMLQKLANIDNDQLNSFLPYWKEYEAPIEFHLHRFDSHLRQHIIQIEKTLYAIGHPMNETKQILRLIYRALAEVENNLIGAGAIGGSHCHKLAERISARATEVAELTAQ